MDIKSDIKQKIILKVKCVDGDTHLPYSFIKKCKMLVTQEMCKDFDNTYLINYSIKELYEAFYIHENLLINDTVIEYNEVLDYLGYDSMLSISMINKIDSFFNYYEKKT